MQLSSPRSEPGPLLTPPLLSLRRRGFQAAIISVWRTFSIAPTSYLVRLAREFVWQLREPALLRELDARGWVSMSSHIGGARQHTRIVFVKNLNYNTTGADLYNVFGRYGAIRQIRIGDAPKTKGTAYVVYQEMADAKRALDNLNGFHLNDRYLVVLAHMPARLAAKADLERREAELAELKQLHNIQDA